MTRMTRSARPFNSNQQNSLLMPFKKFISFSEVNCAAAAPTVPLTRVNYQCNPRSAPLPPPSPGQRRGLVRCRKPIKRVMNLKLQSIIKVSSLCGRFNPTRAAPPSITTSRQLFTLFAPTPAERHLKTSRQKVLGRICNLINRGIIN